MCSTERRVTVACAAALRRRSLDWAEFPAGLGCGPFDGRTRRVWVIGATGHRGLQGEVAAGHQSAEVGHRPQLLEGVLRKGPIGHLAVTGYDRAAAERDERSDGCRPVQREGVAEIGGRTVLEQIAGEQD